MVRDQLRAPIFDIDMIVDNRSRTKGRGTSVLEGGWEVLLNICTLLRQNEGMYLM